MIVDSLVALEGRCVDDFLKATTAQVERFANAATKGAVFAGLLEAKHGRSPKSVDGVFTGGCDSIIVMQADPKARLRACGAPKEAPCDQPENNVSARTWLGSIGTSQNDFTTVCDGLCESGFL